MAVSGQMIMKIDMQQTNVLDLLTATAPFSITNTATYTDGAGAAMVNQVWSDTRTLGTSATEDLDLTGTALTNSFGVAVAFARIKGIYIKAAAANTNNVLVEPASANGWVGFLKAAGDQIILRPGYGILLFGSDATGYAVTAGTGDLLTVTNSAGSTTVSYDIMIIGALT